MAANCSCIRGMPAIHGGPMADMPKMRSFFGCALLRRKQICTRLSVRTPG